VGEQVSKGTSHAGGNNQKGEKKKKKETGLALAKREIYPKKPSLAFSKGRGKREMRGKEGGGLGTKSRGSTQKKGFYWHC